MKLRILAAALLLALSCMTAPAWADPVDPVSQLLKTRACVGCNLQGADLKNADLRGVNLSQADLRRADLTGALMMSVNLTDANLEEANLRGAGLLVVNFTRANLRGANISGTSPDSSIFCNTIDPIGQEINRDCPS